ncbi:unnamed protein product, partial [Allacma fusca]
MEHIDASALMVPHVRHTPAQEVLNVPAPMVGLGLDVVTRKPSVIVFIRSKLVRKTWRKLKKISRRRTRELLVVLTGDSMLCCGRRK